MAETLADIQARKLPAMSGITGSISDMLFKYYSGLSGLLPATSYSRQDHERAYYVAQTGASGSMGDLEKAFYDLKAIPAGSMLDRQYAYWNGLP